MRLRFVIGRDTRESGTWIEEELARGLTSEGATVVSAGVVPTPAVAYLARTEGFDAGLVISASHNPYQDNGIKVFGGSGTKLTEQLEASVETAGRRSRVVRAWRRRPDRATRSVGPLRRASRPDHEDGGTPRRISRRDRLREWRHGGDRAAALQGPRPGGGDPRRLAGRPQHQSQLRIDAPRRAVRRGRRLEGQARRGLRRRRRSGAVRRSRRPRRGRRRHPADGGDLLEGSGPAARQRHRGHGDEQHRPRDRVAQSRHRDGPDRGGRQVRDGGDDQARPRARRRAVGPCHLLGSSVYRRRSRHRAQRAAHHGRYRQGARGAGRARSSRIRKCSSTCACARKRITCRCRRSPTR